VISFARHLILVACSVTALFAAAPVNVSVTPSSGSGYGPQVFHFVFSDADGAGDINWVQMLTASGGLSGLQSCYFYVWRPSGLVYLANDNGIGWAGSGTLGTSGTLQNTQCALDLQNSSKTEGGSQLTVSLRVLFAASYAGAYNVYMYAGDAEGNEAPWEVKGNWTAPGNVAPQVISASPSSGSGTSQTFQFAFADGNGYQNLKYLTTSIYPGLSAANGCWFMLSRGENAFYLMNDDVTLWLGPLTVGSVGSIENSQCRLNGWGSGVSGVGNNLTFAIPVTFKPGYTGSMQINHYVDDVGGLVSGWVQTGTWTVPAPNSVPTLTGVTPSTGSGFGPQTFQFVFSDADGAADINWVQMLTASGGLSGLQSCSFYVWRPSGVVYLTNDSGLGWVGSAALGTTGTLQNTQCTLDLQNSSKTEAGTQLTINLHIQFAATYAGAYNVYMYAGDTGGNVAPWEVKGNWTVPGNVAPQVISASPSSGSGTSQTFQFTFADANGYQNLKYLTTSIYPGLSAANGCYIGFFPGENAFYLMNDNVTLWLGPVTIGSAGSVENSQCRLSGSGSAVSGVGNNLTFTIPVTFKPGYTGSMQIYHHADDVGGLVSGWVQTGTWTVPVVQQFYLTTAVSPAGGGTVSPASGWHDSGTVVWVSAAANPGYQFSGFSGDLAGTTTPQPLTMNGPKTVTANFAAQPQYYLTTAVWPSGAGTISPASGWYNSGAVVWVSATANPGYQFSGFSGDLTGTTTPQPLRMNGPKTVTANFAVQPQYYLTTAVWPSGGGTISPVSGWYSADSVVTVTATANSGYQFSGFSGALSGLANPQTVTINGPLTIRANFLPSLWKGINYSPRQHSYFRMLYDWDAYSLGPTVDADLTALSQAGFNMIHLYIWDQDTFPFVQQPAEPSGFINPAGEPSQSPNNQWARLNDFVTKAENHGIFVILDFASAWAVTQTNAAPDDPAVIDAMVVNPYAAWIGKFIRYLCYDNHHRNILGWSSYWSLGFAANVAGKTALTNPPPPGQEFSKFTYIFAKLYKSIDDLSRQYSPAPGILGLLATGPLDFTLDTSSAPSGSTMILRGTGYQFTWSNAQRVASTMRSLLSQLYGGTKDPDLYVIGGYHANSWDFSRALNDLITNNANGFPIPASKILVTEWATSSSLGPSSNGVPYYGATTDPAAGNGYPAYGDANAPTMTVPGHAAWVQNTLCTFRDAGIQKLAYWSMYDPYTLWSAPPWSQVTQGLAWNGYWGLAYEEPVNGFKPAWSSVLQPYYQFGTLSCPAGSVFNAAPILSLTPISHTTQSTSRSGRPGQWPMLPRSACPARSTHGRAIRNLSSAPHLQWQAALPPMRRPLQAREATRYRRQRPVRTAVPPIRVRPMRL
jgi:hypothetical protein